MILRSLLSDTWIGRSDGPAPEHPSSVGGGAPLTATFWALVLLIVAAQVAPFPVAATGLDPVLGIGFLYLPYAAMMSVAAIFASRFLFGGLLSLPMVLALLPAFLICGLVGRLMARLSKQAGPLAVAVGLLPVWTFLYLSACFVITRWTGLSSAQAPTTAVLFAVAIALLTVAAYRAYGWLWMRRFDALSKDEQRAVLKDQGKEVPGHG